MLPPSVLEFRRALERDEFRVEYQAIVELATGAVVGAEALLRWSHPERGELLPESFIDQAESSSLVLAPLGAFVLGEACRQAVSWPSGAHGPLSVSVNLGALQLRAEPAVVDVVREALRESRLDPARLVLELTERAMIDDLDVAATTLTELHGLGAHLALDDLGTGYSSLLRLIRLPIDEIKLDRELIVGVSDDRRANATVRALICLAEALSLTVVGEGIESVEQVIALIELGCELGQGFFFARPLPAAVFLAQLDA